MNRKIEFDETTQFIEYSEKFKIVGVHYDTVKNLLCNFSKKELGEILYYLCVFASTGEDRTNYKGIKKAFWNEIKMAQTKMIKKYVKKNEFDNKEIQKEALQFIESMEQFDDTNNEIKIEEELPF